MIAGVPKLKEFKSNEAKLREMQGQGLEDSEAYRSLKEDRLLSNGGLLR